MSHCLKTHFITWAESYDKIVTYDNNDNTNNCIIFNIYNDIFKIISYMDNDSILYSIKSIHKWIWSFNIYIITNKPSFDSMINNLYKVYNEKVKIIPYIIPKIIDLDIQSINKTINIQKLCIYLKECTKDNVDKIITNKLHNQYIKLYSSPLCMNEQIKLQLVNDNIYIWNIKFYKFNYKLNTALNELPNKYIEINISFNNILYPAYPPDINILYPLFKNNLINRIYSLKLFNINYYDPNKSIVYIVDKLHKIFNKHAIIQDSYLISKQELQLELEINELNKYFDQTMNDHVQKLDEYDNSYNKIVILNENDKNTYPNTWTSDNYYKMISQSNSNIALICNNIINIISDDIPIISSRICNIITTLNKFFISILSNINLLIINDSIIFYDYIFNIINSFVEAPFKNLFLFKYNKQNLFSIIYRLRNECLSSNTDVPIIITIYTKLKSVIIIDDELINVSIKKEACDKYIHEMSKLRFHQNDLFDSNYVYKVNIKQDEVLSDNIKNRLTAEYTCLYESLLINPFSSIFITIHYRNMRALRFLVIGPKNTPYENGCYIYDTCITDAYPNKQPVFRMVTNINCNDNIQNTIKNEVINFPFQWDSSNHSIINILYSLQKDILSEDPYFNKSNHSNEINTVDGNINSSKYNELVRYTTMKNSIYNVLSYDKFAPFSKIINNHFYLKKEEIIATCMKWISIASTDNVHVFEELFDKIKDVLYTLNLIE